MSAPYAECDLDAIVAGVQRQSLQLLTLQIANITLAAIGDMLLLPNPLRPLYLDRHFSASFNSALAAAESTAGAGISAASDGPPTDPLAAT